MAIKVLITIILTTCLTPKIIAQKIGCTDKQASNFDSTAQQNDGSCIYPMTSYQPFSLCSKMSDSLIESSGLLFYHNWFWTHNDGGNENKIYAFDSISGKIIHQTIILNKTNVDWEEITQDDSCIYIGEFGNNNGDRTDLKIYIIKKTALKLNQAIDSIDAEEIKFSYADQTSFLPANQNHDFDMEAMCILADSIHLFSKNWTDKKTRHYILPKSPGNYLLKPRENFPSGGLITSACSNKTGDIIILGGYNTTNGSCFMWMLWDYKNNQVFNGNKRKIELGNALTLGQFEASAFKNDVLYFTNEKRFTEAGLWRVNIKQWFTKNPVTNIIIQKKPPEFKVYQKEGELIVVMKKGSGFIDILNSSGMKIISHQIDKEKMTFDISLFAPGLYFVEVNGNFQKIIIEP